MVSNSKIQQHLTTFSDYVELNTFRKPADLPRAPLMSLKLNNRISSVRESSGNLQRAFTEPANELRESQFKKSLLQKIIAARESCDENSPKPTLTEQNSQSLKRGFSQQEQSLITNTSEREKSTNPTPINLEPSIKPFVVDQEGEKSPNTPSFHKEKSGNFRFQSKLICENRQLKG